MFIIVELIKALPVVITLIKELSDFNKKKDAKIQ